MLHFHASFFFQKYMQRLLAPIFSRVGFEGSSDEAHLDSFLRSLVVSWACSMRMSECTDQARDNFKMWMDSLNPDREDANP